MEDQKGLLGKDPKGLLVKDVKGLLLKDENTTKMFFNQETFIPLQILF